jgi:hypothetical protein
MYIDMFSCMPVCLPACLVALVNFHASVCARDCMSEHVCVCVCVCDVWVYVCVMRVCVMRVCVPYVCVSCLPPNACNVGQRWRCQDPGHGQQYHRSHPGR